ncbi:ECF transporter S component [Paramicrobacterium chengjingii]|uniref:ECF transporter S component n=1 Tax=Paramicrobacterium chengjingii TaxID=2769067 RepID=UPI001422BF49|nr:ECF transporter S component [Microbacterium chengjingii]
MEQERDDEAKLEGSFDGIVTDLRELRVNTGVVTYAEIARRIGRYRGQLKGDGVNDAPARSTVYDAFRLGRSRLNPELVGEIVRALGEDEQSVRQWMVRCYQVQASSERNCERDAVCTEDPVESPGITQPLKSHRSRYIYVGSVMFACVLLNAFGYALVGKLHLALYLDMVGTAVGAIMLGPWYGVAIAVLGNAAGMTIHGPMALVFALVNVAGALVWGYGVRRSTWAATFTQFFRLNLVVAVVCTLVAVPLLMLGYHGGSGHTSDQLTHTFTSSGQNLLSAVLLSNGITSILDKLATGFIALVVIQRCTSRIKSVDSEFVSPVDNFFRFALRPTTQITRPLCNYSAVLVRTP